MTFTQEWDFVRELFMRVPECADCPYKVLIGDLYTGRTFHECSLGTRPYDKPNSCPAYLKEKDNA